VRIPKVAPDQAGRDELLIRSVSRSRAGWDEAFAAMPNRDQGMLDEEVSTNWDESEWEW